MPGDSFIAFDSGEPRWRKSSRVGFARVRDLCLSLIAVFGLPTQINIPPTTPLAGLNNLAHCYIANLQVLVQVLPRQDYCEYNQVSGKETFQLPRQRSSCVASRTDNWYCSDSSF